MLPKVSSQSLPPGRQARFQGGLYSALGALEKNTIGDTLVKEIVGINLPKILFTRTYDERLDVATSEIGNTVAFVAGGLSLERLLMLGLNAAKKGARKLPVAAHWERISRSLGLYSGIFALMWAMPFVRNYVTAKRTGTDQFADVITNRPQAVGMPAPPDLKASLDRYKKQIATILGLGALGSVLSLGIGVLGIRKGWGETLLPKLLDEGRSVYDALRMQGVLPSLTTPKSGEASPWMQRAFKQLGRLKLDSLLLKDGKFSNFSGLPALLFWGLPAYGGWIHASRDHYEKREQLIKFANFVACFFGPSVLLGRYFQGKFAKQFQGVPSLSYEAIAKAYANDPERRRQALSLWTKKVGLSLGSSVALLGIMPQWISIKMTQYRMQHARREQAEREDFQSSPPIGLHRKSYPQWGHPVEALPVGLPDSRTMGLPFPVAVGNPILPQTCSENKMASLWPTPIESPASNSLHMNPEAAKRPVNPTVPVAISDSPIDTFSANGPSVLSSTPVQGVMENPQTLSFRGKQRNGFAQQAF